MSEQYWVLANHRESGPFTDRTLAEEFAVKLAEKIDPQSYQSVEIITRQVDDNNTHEETREMYIDYQASGKLNSAIRIGDNDYNQRRFLILVEKGAEWVVSTYTEHADQWDSGRYFNTHECALEHFLARAAETFDIVG